MIKITIIFKCVKGRLSQQGMTLVELVMAVVILGFVMLSLTKLLGDVSLLSTEPDYRQTSMMLAQELMEEIKSKRFDELEAKTASGNWSVVSGPDAGETSGDSSTYDDVDDFDQWSESLTAPFSGYSRTVDVDYVSGDDLNTAMIIPDPVTDNWTPDYKRIQVTVSHSPAADVTITTVIGAARSRETF